MHAHIHSMYITPYVVAVNCRHALPIRLLSKNLQGTPLSQKSGGFTSPVSDSSPPSLVWNVWFGEWQSSPRQFFFSCPQKQLHTIPTSEESLRTGRKKNQYLHTAVSGPRCHRPLGPKPVEALWSSVSHLVTSWHLVPIHTTSHSKTRKVIFKNTRQYTDLRKTAAI